MSIKGIDTQIMITRLPDNARDTSALQKRPEVAQDIMAVREKIIDVEKQTRVAKMSESEMEKIHADNEGGGGGYGSEGGAGDGKHNYGEEPDAGAYVPSEKHIIDITI